MEAGAIGSWEVGGVEVERVEAGAIVGGVEVGRVEVEVIGGVEAGALGEVGGIESEEDDEDIEPAVRNLSLSDSKTCK